jgi:hypothetical protein
MHRPSLVRVVYRFKRESNILSGCAAGIFQYQVPASGRPYFALRIRYDSLTGLDTRPDLCIAGSGGRRVDCVSFGLNLQFRSSTVT